MSTLEIRSGDTVVALDNAGSITFRRSPDGQVEVSACRAVTVDFEGLEDQ